MQKQKTRHSAVAKGLVSVLLIMLTMLSVIAGVQLSASAAGSYTVVEAVDGTISYVGTNYATGATNQSLSFALCSGFLVSDGSKNYWATCAFAGYDAPPDNTAYGELLTVGGNLADGYNNVSKDVDGSHYVINPEANDPTWGSGRQISYDFIFRCFYYANKYMKSEFSALSVSDCTLQEAIVIAYRYEWDTRLIQYKTGEMVNGSWVLNTDVDSWGKNPHLTSVSTNKAIVDAANKILVYAMKDPEGISGNIDQPDDYTLSYTADGKTCTLQRIYGPATVNGKTARYQDLLIYSPFSVEEYYPLQVKKVDENGNPLKGAYFRLYRKNASGTYTYVSVQVTDDSGVAMWNSLVEGDYYVQEYIAPPGYKRDDTKYYRTLDKNSSTDQPVTITVYNYPDPVTWTPEAIKKLVGGTLKSGQFTFELRQGSQTGKVLQTKKNDENGDVLFDELSFSSEGTYKYYIHEVIGSDPGITYDTHWLVYTVTVTKGNNGLTVSASRSGDKVFTNTKKGAIGVKKVDASGKPVSGVKFGVYTNSACTAKVTEIITGEDGTATYGLNADGEYSLVAETIYYLKEISPKDETWVLNSTVYPVKVVYATTTYANNGKGIVNEQPTGSWTPTAEKVLKFGTLTDGQFAFVLRDGDGRLLEITTNDASGAVVFSTFKYDYTDKDKKYTYSISEIKGDDKKTIYSENVLVYTVEITYSGTGDALIITETITEGEKVFENTYFGEIGVIKSGIDGTLLSGAEFLLEWSEDGVVWQPVTASEEIVTGGCTSEGLTDGKLIVGSDGKVIYEGLQPELYYRLTETKAPEGMQLLTEPAYEGKLPLNDDFVVELCVVNAPVFTLPQTGSNGFGFLMIALPLFCCGGAMFWICRHNKRKQG